MHANFPNSVAESTGLPGHAERACASPPPAHSEPPPAEKTEPRSLNTATRPTRAATQQHIKIAALQRPTIYLAPAPAATMTPPSHVHTRSPRKTIEGLITAREIALAKTPSAKHRQR